MPGKIILISWHHHELEVSIFPIQQMLLHQMLKTQKLPAHVVCCFHLKTTVPYILHVKGPSILIDCLGRDEFDTFFAPLSDVHVFFLCFWQQEIELFNNNKMWVIITKHISCFNFVYFRYTQIYCYFPRKIYLTRNKGFLFVFLKYIKIKIPNLLSLKWKLSFWTKQQSHTLDTWSLRDY